MLRVIADENYPAEFAPVIRKMANPLADRDRDGEGPRGSGFPGQDHAVLRAAGRLHRPEAERRKLADDLTYYEGFLASVMKKLSNERFVQSAPEGRGQRAGQSRPTPRRRSRPSAHSSQHSNNLKTTGGNDRKRPSPPVFHRTTPCRRSPSTPTARPGATPGPGGYVRPALGPYRKELSQGFRRTTNNRMELMGVCAALELLRFDGSDVTIYSDSKYVVDAVTKGWSSAGERKGFADKKNPDLWQRFLRSYRHNVRFVWVRDMPKP